MGTTSKFIQRKMMSKSIFFWGILLFGVSLVAQEGEVINHIFEGNEQASAELFDEAEMAYRRALSKAPEKPEALYNLGNTHFQEQDFDEAKQRFFQTQKFAENKSSKHHAFHNLVWFPVLHAVVWMSLVSLWPLTWHSDALLWQFVFLDL